MMGESQYNMVEGDGDDGDDDDADDVEDADLDMKVDETVLQDGDGVNAKVS
jgi:hypothetical protein